MRVPILCLDFAGVVLSAIAWPLGAPLAGIAGLLYFGAQMSVEWSQLWRGAA